MTTEEDYINQLLKSLYQVTNVESLFYVLMQEYVDVAHNIAAMNPETSFSDLCFVIVRAMSDKNLMGEVDTVAMFAVVTAYIGRHSSRTEGESWLTFNTPTGSPMSTAQSETVTTNTSSDSSDPNKKHKTP